ncbi:hypothetical protein FRC02_010571 [Tulasnella sp. 418]|nr:hypothetical protein FRC02_010571 [Tulasnella sp. 418]
MESWIVVFKPETTKEDIDRFLEYVVSEGGEIKFIYESLNSFAAKLPNEFVTSLQSDMPPIIAYIGFLLPGLCDMTD